MKTKEIHQLAIKMGIKADFRGEKEIKRLLKRRRKKYSQLSEKEKKEFDKELLFNPFADTRILHIAKDKPIKKVLVGIDISPAEILLAKELKGIDLIISHHPLGKALATLHEVIDLQIAVLSQYGVPINIAEALTRLRISEVARRLGALNHQRTVDAARLLGFNLLCVHTAADNLAASFLKKLIEKEKKNLERLEDLINLLKKIPEYQEATKFGAGPKIYVGRKDSYCGKIVLVEITGGTETSPKIYKKMAQAGIGTVVGMHISEEHKKEAEASYINVVIAGHISSDSLGMNLFLDELEKRGIEIIPCSGLIRIKRVRTKK